jgi:hypothetical protein
MLLGPGKEQEAIRFTADQLKALNASEGPLLEFAQILQQEMVSKAAVQKMKDEFGQARADLLAKLADLETRVTQAAADPAIWDGHPSHWALWIGGFFALMGLAAVVAGIYFRLWTHPIVARIRQVYADRCRQDRLHRRQARAAEVNAAQQRELRVLHAALEIPRIEEDDIELLAPPPRT